MAKECIVKEYKLTDRSNAVGEAIRDYENDGYSVDVHYAGGMIGSVLLVCSKREGVTETIVAESTDKPGTGNVNTGEPTT